MDPRTLNSVKELNSLLHGAHTWIVKNGDENGLLLRFCDALLVTSG